MSDIMPHISHYLYAARETANPVASVYLLARAAWKAVRQGRGPELLHFARERAVGALARSGLKGSPPPASVAIENLPPATVRTGPGTSLQAELLEPFESVDDGRPIRVFVWDLGAPAPAGRIFPTRRQNVARVTSSMVVVGEYEPSGDVPGARVAILDLARRRFRIAFDLLPRRGTKHVHVVHYRASRAELLVCTGDARKPLYACNVDAERLALGDLRTLRMNNAGFTAAMRWGDGVLFGTDFFAQENSLVHFSDDGFESFYLPSEIRGCFFTDCAPLNRLGAEQAIFCFTSVFPFRRAGFLVFDLGQRRIAYAAHGSFSKCQLDLDPDGAARGVVLDGRRLGLVGGHVLAPRFDPLEQPAQHLGPAGTLAVDTAARLMG